MAWILAIDQSTAGTKAMLVDNEGQIIHKADLSHKQYYPQPGWVEHDAEEIWQNVVQLVNELPAQAQVSHKELVALALTNQRETTVAWDRQTGQPLAPAVVWQCQRGEQICARLKTYSNQIREKTGLPLSPYYPAAKAAWLLENIEGLKDKAVNGSACIGTVDSYLLYRLTGGQVFATDYSNASRTQLFNLETLSWDQDILSCFGIPLSAIANVKASDDIFGTTVPGLFPAVLKIAGVLGDSHAALFGQGCIERGMAKATYGTGSSLMINIGEKKVPPPAGIAASLAWGWQDRINYVLEGNVTSSGDTLKWLCDELQLLPAPRDIDDLAETVPDTNGTYLVPAFSGLGAPHFDSKARAAIIGLCRNTNRAHVARAALESIAYQNADIIDAMGIKLQEIRVDGGTTRSDVLMQFQADLLGCDVICSEVQEISALGVAYMCGIKLGFYSELHSVLSLKKPGRRFVPSLGDEKVKALKDGWHDAVRRVRG